LIDTPHVWLSSDVSAIFFISVVHVWGMLPLISLILIAGLQSIPEELYEAARLDGAGAVRRFRHVTLPMLGPTMLFVAVITMIGYFQVFTEPYVMTAGGPLKATTTMVLLMYEEGFRWWRMGVAAAYAFALFIIILAGTLIQTRIQRVRI
jgi:multiple sugar transport system permease protein